MKEIILLNEITPSKTNIFIVASEMSERVKNGEINPVEFQIKAKFVEDVLKLARKDVQDEAINEVMKNGKECMMLGAKVEVCETGTKYDYSRDEKWVEINERFKVIEEERKAQEEKIKMATKIGADAVDTESGEVVARKVIKTSETNTKITLGK